MISWTPQPKQERFLYCQADEALYGGAAGGAKSDAALHLAIIRRVKHPGTSGLILRRTLPQLEGGDGLIPRSKKILSHIATYSERKHWWTFPNGSVLEFGYCDKDDDVYKYDGGEYADIFFEELTHFTEHQYTYLKTRLRAAKRADGTEIPTIIRATAMPGNVGHSWVKSLFIDPAPDGGEWTVDIKDPESGKKFHVKRAFIPAFLSDNKYLGPDYHRNLLTQDEATRDALLYGKWDAFKGQYFNMWDPNIHVMERKVEPHWERQVAIDYGYAAPFCTLWGAVDEKGRVHFYREIYRSRMRDEEQACAVLEFSRGEKITTFKAGKDVFNKRGESGRSASDVWSEYGLHVVAASNDRVPGWSRMKSFLSTMIEGIPALTISPSCENLIRTIPAMVHDKKKVEDVDGKCEDHACEAARYWLADFRGCIVEKPREMEYSFERHVAWLHGKKHNKGLVEGIRDMKAVRF